MIYVQVTYVHTYVYTGLHRVVVYPSRTHIPHPPISRVDVSKKLLDVLKSESDTTNRDPHWSEEGAELS